MKRVIAKTLQIVIIVVIIVFALLVLFEGYTNRYVPSNIKKENDGLYDYKGSIHVHSIYSADARGTIEKIMEDARKAGIDFVILSDHNTLNPLKDKKEGYYNNVLMLVGVEVSSKIGHYLVYSSSKDFINYEINNSLHLYKENNLKEHFTVFCHPFHKRIPIKDWSYKGFDALEIFNMRSERENDSVYELITALFGALVFSNPLNNLIDYPEKSIEKWSELLKERRIFQIGVSDAHSNTKVARKFKIPIPSYETVLKSVKTHILTKEKMLGFIDRDRAIVFDCLERGSCYTELGNFFEPAGFMFTAGNSEKEVLMGGEVDGTVTFAVDIPDNVDCEIVLHNTDRIVHATNNEPMQYTTSEPGAYWVEVFLIRKELPFLKKARKPWIISNPIFLLGKNNPL